ncbi:MAG TPA: hypothetical protein VLJ86_06150 [Ramlibacter sp.]|nr:hypothetical protein [Ramlibacter sp.]
MKNLTQSVIVLLAASASILFAAGASAAKVSEAQLRYQEERAVCMSGASNQDRATCLREASAALGEAKRGNLTAGDLAHGRMVRCDALPAQDRQDCVMRMQGQGTTSGSAQQGGVLRELERPVPAR